jgi:hypothetical protein
MEFNINDYKTLESLNAFRQEINEACDKRAEVIITTDKANELSKKPFGYIKESIEALSPELFGSKAGRSLLSKYTSLVRSNKSLSSMQMLYENIRKTNRSSDVDFFINSMASTDWNIDKKDLKEGLNKIGDVLAKAYITVGKDTADSLLPEENVALNSAVQYIVENKKTSKNLANYSAAVKVLRENIEKNENTGNVFESKSLDASVVSKLLEAYNEKYGTELTDEEKAIIKEVADSKTPKDVFNKYKNSCMEKVSEVKNTFEASGDKESVKRLDSIFEQVSKKEYSAETIGEDICNLVEISKIFE